ncbi:MAG: hypothetical protein HETSPECPRED_004291 [Heterodermia speciosa]|uniref:Rhodopsin domain-containing protein n=1 Tax=Heterodermia speciosa TaxID=116794 RepID=A0A8H3FBK5_9LECA|nr:MAG: hypothetical protein HETSPECPRED_004291 [Heterodermia speciosa]
MASNGTISEPLAVITPDKHGGLIIITNAFGLILVLIFLVIRVLSRVVISPPFDRDDLALVVATLGFLYHIFCFDILSDLVIVQKVIYAADIFFLITMWCSKCSVALTFIRLTPQKKHKTVARGIMVATTVWLVLSIFLIALRCDLSQPWIFIGTKCQDLVTRWRIINSMDIALEVALFVMAILLVKNLQMELKRKIFVVTAFGLRLAIIAAIVLRLHYLDPDSLYRNPTLAGVFFAIWTIVEVDFSIISGNIACLKPFMAAFNTSYGGVEEINALSRLDRTGHSGLSSVGSMKFGKGSKVRKAPGPPKEPQKISEPQPRTDALGHEAEVTHEDAESVGSHGSRQMIIQKEITWNVEYHTPNPVKRGTAPNSQYSV